MKLFLLLILSSFSAFSAVNKIPAVMLAGSIPTSKLVGDSLLKTEGTTNGRTHSFIFDFYGASAGTTCGTSPCGLNQVGNHVTSVTRSGLLTYVINFSRTYLQIKCVGNGGTASTLVALMKSGISNFSCSSCNSISIVAGGSSDVFGTVHCMGTY